jgi:hypothetical protein
MAALMLAVHFDWLVYIGWDYQALGLLSCNRVFRVSREYAVLWSQRWGY